MRGLLSVAVAVVALAGVAAPASAASPATSLVWYQGPTYLGSSEQDRLLIPPDASFSISGTGTQFTVTATRQSDEHAVTFAAPTGRTLQAGKHYIRAQLAGSTDPGRPGVAVRAPNTNCADASGSFEIRDLALSEQGTVKRAWVVFAIGCGLLGTDIWGEVRFGMPAPAPGSLTVAPAVMRWPEDDLLRPPASRYVWAIGQTACQRVARMDVIGSSAFGVGECYRNSVDPPDSFRVNAAIDRPAAGTQQAKLRFTETGGATHDGLPPVRWTRGD